VALPPGLEVPGEHRYPYCTIRDRFAGAEGRWLRAVKLGHGMTLERAGAMVAASRRFP